MQCRRNASGVISYISRCTLSTMKGKTTDDASTASARDSASTEAVASASAPDVDEIKKQQEEALKANRAELRAFLGSFHNTEADKPVPELWQGLEKIVLALDLFDGLYKHAELESDGDSRAELLQHVRTCEDIKSEIVGGLLRHGIGQRAIEEFCAAALARKKGADLRTIHAAEEEPSKPVERGKFCDQVTAEIKRIRELCRSHGRTVAEIQQAHPEFAAWKVRAQLCAEDQDIFNHPNQWGPVVGYAQLMLGNAHGVKPGTINSWVKAYRKTQRNKKA